METLKVLVVDDEEGMREGVRRALTGMRVEIPEADQVVELTIETASTGQEALDILASHPPDLLLLDYKLPDISGLDILRRLAEGEQDLLTVMITAYATLQTAITATRRGAYDFLAKPYNPGELRNVVTKAAHHLVLKRRARALSDERRRVRFDFVRVLAHELKSPLASVEGFLYLLRDGHLDGDPDMRHEVVVRSIQRLGGMRKLIADLLDMTHLESGTRDRHLKRLDLCALTRQVLEDFEPVAGERQVYLTLNCPETLSMMADPEELGIVFNNLISNAIKYNRPEGLVEITLGVEGELANIAVRDTGIGMSAEERERIFGEFVRIKNTRTAGVEGSGLGLAILRKVVDLYHGRIEVQSEPDVGSTFSLWLDLHGGERDAE